MIGAAFSSVVAVLTMLLLFDRRPLLEVEGANPVVDDRDSSTTRSIREKNLVMMSKMNDGPLKEILLPILWQPNGGVGECGAESFCCVGPKMKIVVSPETDCDAERCV
jgi:hypothetical protein